MLVRPRNGVLAILPLMLGRVVTPRGARSTPMEQFPPPTMTLESLRSEVFAVVDANDRRHAEHFDVNEKRYAEHFAVNEKRYEEHFAVNERRYSLQFDANEKLYREEIDAMRQSLAAAIASTDKLYDQRLAANEKRYEDQFTSLRESIIAHVGAAEKRYEEQFIALRESINVAVTNGAQALQQAVGNQRTAVAAAMAASTIANEKADATFEKRFESTNEWRAAMADRERDFMPRAEAEQRNKVLDERVASLIDRMSNITGRSSAIGDSWHYIVAGAGVLIGFISTVFVFLGK